MSSDILCCLTNCYVVTHRYISVSMTSRHRCVTSQVIRQRHLSVESLKNITLCRSLIYYLLIKNCWIYNAKITFAHTSH